VSFLYIIASNPAGPVKLGLSINPEKRVRQLQTGCSETLILYHAEEVEPGRVKIAEKALHRLLSYKRVRGEWFDLSVEDAIFEVVHIRMMEG
jgi:hypothetical protein